MPALMQKPATAQMIDRRCRSAGVRPNTVTATVDASSTPMVSVFTPNRCVSSPSTAPPMAPPTFVHTSTPAAADAAKPRSTTIFGTHFTMK